MLTARRPPDWEGLLTISMLSLVGRVAPRVVEPPPSRPTTSTQPSSIIRWATWVREAPTL